MVFGRMAWVGDAGFTPHPHTAAITSTAEAEKIVKSLYSYEV
jgi:hypothetical protein